MLSLGHGPLILQSGEYSLNAEFEVWPARHSSQEVLATPAPETVETDLRKLT